MSLLAKVIVTPKPVVNDPQGVTVRGGLAHLGFAEVRDVRVGKYIEIRLDAPSEDEARRRVEEMCGRLLANHVIEDFRFELSEVDTDAHSPADGIPAGPEYDHSPADGGGWEAPEAP
ncbi:MAG TPA: phosphoribosylformylglycinamidine synthase subunit PurS [Candidatus Dormibacteraeota bacterium]